MNSVILITKEAVTLQELFVMLRDRWPNTSSNPLGGLVVEDGEDHLFIDVYTEASEEYEPEELENIVKLMSSPRF